jgi:hypothetical protein
MQELRRRSSNIAYGWKITLVDNATTPIFRMYQAALGRDPEPDGIASAWDLLNRFNLTPLQFANAMADSAEFKARFASTGSSQTVTPTIAYEFYRAIFQREPAVAEIAGWSGITVGVMLDSFVRSTEFLNVSSSILAFTSSDVEFRYDDVIYKPTNGLMGSATSSKQNLSVDNMSVTSLINDQIKEIDLRSGRFDNAAVEVFWICPTNPQWGILPLKGGRFGEVQVKNASFEVELRSLAQFLQQPFGEFYMLECSAQLGDANCKVPLKATIWRANTQYVAAPASGDAHYGDLVQPSTPNGFWYRNHQSSGAYTTFIDDLHGSAGSGGVNAGGNTDPPLGGLFGGNNNGTGIILVAQGGEIIGGAVPEHGTSGGTEPAWPTTLDAVIGDNTVAWKAIYARKWRSQVTGVFSRAQFQDSSLPFFPPGYFTYGVMTWLTGENAGLSMEIRGYDRVPQPVFYLLEAMPYRVAPDDGYEVTIGCAHTRPACKDQFDNIHNMRAFPDMPTEDRALTTPNFTQSGTSAPPDSGGS